MRLLYALVAMVGAATSARAEPDPDEGLDTEEELRAIRDRGVVLAAGKRNYIVVVPRVKPKDNTPQGAKYHGARIYFGDAKTLYPLGRPDSKMGTTETLWLPSLAAFEPARLVRQENRVLLVCGSTERSIELRNTEAASALFKKTELKAFAFPHDPYLLAREEHGTTYYLLDRPRTVGNTSLEFRLFVGKRGAMKQLPIKEQSSDYESDIFIAKSGTLTIRKKKARIKGDSLSHAPAETALFGTDKKRAQLEILDMDQRQNYELVYRGLGVYTRDTAGLPCEVL